MTIHGDLGRESFSDIDLRDPFFDSLKEAYKKFADWFQRKSEEKAFVMRDEKASIQGFVYLKEENEAITDVIPELPHDRYLKLGTFKINAHGTKLGERLIKKAFDYALDKGIKKLYVTVFPEHLALISLLKKYGYKEVGIKNTSDGTEKVFLKTIGECVGDVLKDYPVMSASRNNKYLLSILPEYHTRLFPDSILDTEDINIVDDISHTNSIDKIYICRMSGVRNLSANDLLVIYRMAGEGGRPWFQSVATSLCMVEEVKSKQSFRNLNSFLAYCSSRSIFSKTELSEYYKWNNLFVIKMTYNVALKKRIIMQRLVEEVGLDRVGYWGFKQLTTDNIRDIARLGGVDDSPVIY